MEQTKMITICINRYSTESNIKDKKGALLTAKYFDVALENRGFFIVKANDTSSVLDLAGSTFRDEQFVYKTCQRCGLFGHRFRITYSFQSRVTYEFQKVIDKVRKENLDNPLFLQYKDSDQ